MRKMVRYPDFEKYLFSKGYFIEDAEDAEHAFEANIALADLFGIRIISLPAGMSTLLTALRRKSNGQGFCTISITSL